MLKAGKYKAENAGGIFDRYTIILDVKETEKSFTLNLVEFDTRYAATQMEDLFRDKKKVVIKKDRSGHAMNIWNDESFTLYPYRVGVPYYFKLMN